MTFDRIDERLGGYVNIEAGEYGTQHKQLPTEAGVGVIRLQKLGTLEGTLTVPPEIKANLRRYHIMAMSQTGGHHINVESTGTFKSLSMEPGEYTLQVGSSESGPRKYQLAETARVKLEPGQQAKVTLTLQPGIPVRGKYLRQARRQATAHRDP